MNRRQLDKMGDKSVQISKLDCLKKLDELAPSKPKQQKLGSFENLQEILSDYDVVVTTPPLELETRKKWQREKQKILQVFCKILDERSTCIKKKNYNYNGMLDSVFFDSESYKLLTTVTPPSSNDPDFVMENETLLDIDIEDELKRKTIGRPYSEKPLMEFSDPTIREKTEEIYQKVIKFCIEYGIPFDKLLAKLALRFYFTAGENFNKQKGQMFNEVVTLEEFHCFIYLVLCHVTIQL